MKNIDLKLLKEKGWCYYDKANRCLKPDKHIVSYCEKCDCQRVHNLVSFSYSTAVFECSFCKEGK